MAGENPGERGKCGVRKVQRELQIRLSESGFCPVTSVWLAEQVGKLIDRLGVAAKSCERLGVPKWAVWVFCDEGFSEQFHCGGWISAADECLGKVDSAFRFGLWGEGGVCQIISKMKFGDFPKASGKGVVPFGCAGRRERLRGEQ